MEYKDNFEFEDIYSSVEKDKKEIENISSSSKKGRHYAKKKRGIAAVFAKIADWWRDRARWQKAVMISCISLVTVAAIVVGVVLSVFDYNYKVITEKPQELGFENVIDKEIVNVALFGIDARKEGSFEGLSDSIMIMSINTKTKKVKIISIMRDSLVPVVRNGKTTYTKINGAYTGKGGGPELAIKTLNTAFGLDISEYATVNFYGMVDIIDAVGGIEVDVAPGEIDVHGYENGQKINWGINGTINEICLHAGLNAKEYFITSPGLQHMNGVQAVGYARVRHAANVEGTNNDYGRTDRQRYVMEQLFNKALTLEKSKYPKFIKALIPCVETSLSYSEIIGLAWNVMLNKPTFEQTRVPLVEYQMTSTKYDGSYVYYDLNYAKKIIHAFIYDDITPEDYIKEYGIETNDWYSKAVGYTNKKPTESGNTNSSGNEPETPSGNEPETPGGNEPETPGGTEPENPGDTEPDNPDDTQPENPTDPNPETQNPDGLPLG